MKYLLLALSIISISAKAQVCENVIALSKTISSTVSDKSAFEQQASNFCNEYKKNASSNSGTNIGASWKFLAASYGNSNMSQDEVASKACSASNSQKSSNDAFKNYIETIAQGAYPAYEQCVKFSQSDVKFDVDLASVLPSEFTVVVGYLNSTSSESANFTYSAPRGVTCSWSEDRNFLSSNKNVSTTLKSPSSAALKCLRTDQTQPAYVRVLRTSGVGGTLTLPWVAYSKEGVPIATLQTIRNSISETNGRLASANANIASLMTAKDIQMHQCPIQKTPGANPGGGAWGFYGCMGQITNTKTCQNIEYPWSETRNCELVGKIKIY